MLREGTPLKAPETTPTSQPIGLEGKYIHTDQGRRHWRRSDLGCLLEILADEHGTEEEVSARLRRTPEAVKKMLERLLSGEITCPPEYADQLQALRNRQAKPLPRRGADPDRAGAQFAALSQQMGLMRMRLRAVAAAAILDLAREVAAGTILPTMLLELLPGDAGLEVIRLAKYLRNPVETDQDGSIAEIGGTEVSEPVHANHSQQGQVERAESDDDLSAEETYD